MQNSFAYPCQKILKRFKDDPDIAPIIQDIDNAYKGVVTFSKEVKKYMLTFIHNRYDDNEEVMALIDMLKKWSKYESFNWLEIFQLQDESYFWYDFLNAYCLWKIYEKHKGFEDNNQSLELLMRLIKNDTTVFAEFKGL